MKEGQNFELLNILREKSKLGQKFIEEALCTAGENDVFISGLFFRKEALNECKKCLIEAQKAENIDDLKKILEEDTIPMGLLNKEKFWQEFQDSIDELYVK